MRLPLHLRQAGCTRVANAVASHYHTTLRPRHNCCWCRSYAFSVLVGHAKGPWAGIMGATALTQFRNVQRRQWSRRWRPARPEAQQRLEHGTLQHFRSGWVLRWHHHQQAWNPLDAISRRSRLQCLHFRLSLLQLHSELWIHHLRWRTSRSVRRHAVVCAGSDHLIISNRAGKGPLYLLVLDDIQLGWCYRQSGRHSAHVLSLTSQR